MEVISIENIIKRSPIVKKVMDREEILWINPNLQNFEEIGNQEISMEDINDAEDRLLRFAPLIMKYFPETIEDKGLIESDLIAIPKMQKEINKKYSSNLKGKLLLKKDSHLAIAGSIKARGGIYEVLKYTEELALKHGLITPDESYDKLASDGNKSFFNEYTIQVGSTGNLGLSIGIISAVIGYKVIVHMSADARQWKKDLLRDYGVNVVEYESDYGEAVKEGRKLSDKNPKSYFIDDENSRSLFLGYAVAAKRLVNQLQEFNVGGDNPLFVYLPCGVGGAPGGIAFGLKQIFKDAVHCFFVEPTNVPSMALGMATGLNSKISVQDIGLSGLTHADGLAVGRPSGFVGEIMNPILSGIFTMKDANLYNYMRDLLDTENIFLEPSACSAFEGPISLNKYKNMEEYLDKYGLSNKMENAIHIAWATGGSLVPEEIREEYKKIYL